MGRRSGRTSVSDTLVPRAEYDVEYEDIDLERGRSDSTDLILERSISRMMSRVSRRSSVYGGSSGEFENEDFGRKTENRPEEDPRETKSDDGDEYVTQKHRSFLRLSLRRARSTSGGSVRKGVLDPAFVEDIRASILEYSRIIKKRRGVGSGLYHVPESTHNWGEKQKSHHVNWSDLFFDVIYVAVAFQAGKLVSSILATQNWYGLWFYYTLFTSIYECWSLKLHYSCRFNSSDISHKLWDITEFLLVALIAGHFPTNLLELEEHSNGQLFGFCVFKLAHQCFHISRWLELYIYGEKARVTRQARSYCIELSIGTIPLLAALLFQVFEYSAMVVITCLFLSSILQIIHEVLSLFNHGLRKNLEEYAVPMHIEYCVHRYGEWTMLMLGEGVMQIILVHFDQRGEKYATFVAAYLLMAALRVLYYSSQPFKAQGHALNQSVRRGFIWLQLQPIESCLIINVGIGLKEELSKPLITVEPGYERYGWFLCLSTALLLILVWLGSILHQGFRKEFVNIPSRIRNLKVFTYAWKFGLSIALIFPAFFKVPSYTVVSICVVVCILQIITHDVWHRLTKENELDTSYLRSLGLETAPDTASHILGLNKDDEKSVASTKSSKSRKSGSSQNRRSQPATSGEKPHGELQDSSASKLAPIAVLLKHKQRAEEVIKSTFHLGQFRSRQESVEQGLEWAKGLSPTEKSSGNLQQDLQKLFTKYGDKQLMRAMKEVIERAENGDL